MKQRLDELPKDKQIIFQCGHGCRGSLAASILKNEGYNQVANLAGGLLAWKAAGLTTELTSAEEINKAA